jgi:hypothetical protein
MTDESFEDLSPVLHLKQVPIGGGLYDVCVTAETGTANKKLARLRFALVDRPIFAYDKKNTNEVNSLLPMES